MRPEFNRHIKYLLKHISKTRKKDHYVIGGDHCLTTGYLWKYSESIGETCITSEDLEYLDKPDWHTMAPFKKDVY